jgi:hypothetical protein
MTKTITLLFLLLTFPAYTQSRISAFFKLSGPEKCWTLTNLFKAGRAHRITAYVRNETAILYRKQELDTFPHGGKLDAFRHAFWMACLGTTIGEKASRKLGKAHEKGNYKAFKKGKTEDGFLQDATAVEMDLYNNEEGLRIAKENKDVAFSDLQQKIISAIREGKMKIMKRDAQGRLTDCNGKVTPLVERKKTDWKMPYCLLPSHVH